MAFGSTTKIPLRRYPRRRSGPLRVLALLCLLLVPGAAGAFFPMALTVGDVAGEGWSVEGVGVSVVAGDGVMAARVAIDRLHLPGLGEVRGLSVECPEAVLDGGGFRCEGGRLDFDHPALRGDRTRLSLDWRFGGRISVGVDGLGFADGRVNLRLAQEGEGWRAAVVARGVDPGRLEGEMREWVQAVTGLLSLSGRIDLDLEATGSGAAAARLDLAVEARELALSDAAGLLAGEGLALTASATVREDHDGHAVDFRLELKGGELYADPVYLAVEEGAPLRIAGRGHYGRGGERIGLQGVEVDHPGAMRATVDAELRAVPQGPTSLVSASLHLHEGHMDGLYETWLRPFLIGTALDDLEIEGLVHGEAALLEGRVASLDLALAEVYLDDRQGRFGLSGIGGRVAWHADGRPGAVGVAFDGGHLRYMPLGAARLALETRGDAAELLEPLAVPFLDGRIEIDDFRMAGLSGGEIESRLGGRLMPVGMERLTAALAWPPLSGTLAGSVSEVRYEGGALSIGGTLVLQVFDGVTLIRNLRLEDPLGAAPVLTGDIDIAGLDLDLVTRTFEFGRIQGRLDGHVHDLMLVGWQPVRFDAGIRTPEGDRTRRRISQKAVDNLSSIGGGVSGVLSTGFMGLFEEFSYGRIGLSCRLEGDVCRMGGAAPANGGYYIVRGSGLPRIDVVGYTREVAWKDLVSRIRGAVGREAGGPVVR